MLWRVDGQRTLADEQISTGGGPAIEGNVATRGDFAGRDTTQHSNVVNFHASPDFLQQFYTVLVSVNSQVTALQTNLTRLDDKIDRQNEVINTMRSDVNTLKIDVLNLKLDTRMIQQSMEVRRAQSEQHSQKLENLEDKVSNIDATTLGVRASLQGINEKMTVQDKIQTAVVIIAVAAAAVWILVYQVIQ